MATGIVNQLSYADPDLVLDADGAPFSGIANGDWTKSCYLASNPSTTATLTMTEVGSTGEYVPSFTPSATGLWRLSYSATVNGETARFGQAVHVLTAAQADPAAALSASEVTVVSPVDAITNNVTLYQADSYDADDSRALDWATTDAATWPTLTGASIAFRAEHRTAGTAITATGSVVTGTGDTKQVRVELAPADTSTAAIGTYTYQVVATLTNTHVVTLATGKLTLIERI